MTREVYYKQTGIWVQNLWVTVDLYFHLDFKTSEHETELQGTFLDQIIIQ